jgi:hypothetical protein
MDASSLARPSTGHSLYPPPKEVKVPPPPPVAIHRQVEGVRVVVDGSVQYNKSRDGRYLYFTIDYFEIYHRIIFMMI